MTPTIAQQAHALRLRAAVLLSRAEILLRDMQEINRTTAPIKADAKTPGKHGSRTIQQFRRIQNIRRR